MKLAPGSIICSMLMPNQKPWLWSLWTLTQRWITMTIGHATEYSAPAKKLMTFPVCQQSFRYCMDCMWIFINGWSLSGFQLTVRFAHNLPVSLTHWLFGLASVIWKKCNSNSLFRIVVWALSVKLLSKECHQATSHYLNQCWPTYILYAIWHYWATMSYFQGRMGDWETNQWLLLSSVEALVILDLLLGSFPH